MTPAPSEAGRPFRVLVTGATGFLGRHVVARLKRVPGVALATSSADPAKAAGCDWLRGTDYVPADVRDRRADWFAAFGRPAAVVHLAWGGLPDYAADAHVLAHLPDHYAFLAGLVRAGARDVTVAGTCLEYGLAEGCLGEETPPEPGTPYGVAKDALRRLMQALDRDRGFGFTWLRLFYTYGPGQREKALLSQLDRAIGEGRPSFDMSDGLQVRDFLPVEEVADGICKVALQTAVRGVVNVCHGTGTTVLDLVTRHLAATGASIRLNRGAFPVPAYEPFRFWGDATRFREAVRAFDRSAFGDGG